MAKILTDWLNEDVCLSQSVVSLDNDFYDGFLLGELLYKYNQQPDFDKFSSRGDPESKVRNYCMLEPTMRQIGVHFNSRIALDLMASKTGVATTLLYEMKSALDRIRRISLQTVAQSANGAEKIVRVVHTGKPSFEKTMANSFESVLRSKMENGNDKLMDAATSQYMDNKRQFRSSVSAGHSQMLMNMTSDVLRQREMGRQRKKHEGEFAEAWDSINVNQWRKNQRIAHDRREFQKHVEFGLQTRKEDKIAQHRATTKLDTYASIDEFDHRMDNGLISSPKKVSQTEKPLVRTIQAPGGGPDAPTLAYIDQDALKAGLDASKKVIAEHHEEGQHRQQMHDRRRRRFIRLQDTAQTKLGRSFFESDVVSQLLNDCQVEYDEAQSYDRVQRYQQVFVENKTNRQQLINNMGDAAAARKQDWEAVEAERELQWVVAGRRDSQHLRKQVLHDAVQSAQNKQALSFVSGLVDKLLDTVDWAVCCRHLGGYNHKLLPPDDATVAAAAADGDGDATASKAGGASTKTGSKNASKTTTPRPKSASAASLEELSTESVGEDGENSAPGDYVIPGQLWKDAVALFSSSFDVAAPLPLPTKLSVTSALYPFCISERPVCSDPDWLFSSGLTADRALADPRALANSIAESAEEKTSAAVSSAAPTAENVAGGDDVVDTASPVAAEPSTSTTTPTPNSSFNALTKFLAETEQREFLRRINEHSSPAGYDQLPEAISSALAEATRQAEEFAAAAAAKAAGGAVLTAEEKPKVMIETPSWLINTPPRYLLGEAVIAVRCAVDPIPEPPTHGRVNTAHVPMRLALCGISNSSRQLLCDAMSAKIVGLRIVSVDDLVRRAFEDALLLVNAPKDDSPAAPDNVADVAAVAAVAVDMSGQDATASVDGAVEVVVQATVASDDVSVNSAAEDPYVVASMKVYDLLSAGEQVSDELYIDLLVIELGKIPERNNGFVIRDFPSTKKQAVLLLEALSGINYDSPRPQPKQYASVYGPAKPEEPLVWDVSNCGLDAVIEVRTSHCGEQRGYGSVVEAAIDESVRRRIEVNSQQTVILHDNVTSVATVQEIYCPELCKDTASISLTIRDDESLELTSFLDTINVLQLFETADYASVGEAVTSKTEELCERFIDPTHNSDDYLTYEDVRRAEAAAAQAKQEAEEAEAARAAEEALAMSAVIDMADYSPDAAPPAGDEGGEDGHDAAAATTTAITVATTEEEKTEGVVVAPVEGDAAVVKKSKKKSLGPSTVVPPDVNAIPAALARPLAAMWSLAEEQSTARGELYYNAIRSVRYQMVQRRRMASDVIHTLLVCDDNRQEIFDEFRESFNSFGANLRFDPDIVAELHLQTLTLGDTLYSMCAARRSKAEDVVKNIALDASAGLAVHRVRCEAAALAESHLSRFFIALHLLFDGSKSAKRFGYMNKRGNELEATVEPTLPPEGGVAAVATGKDAKGKDAKGAADKGKKAGKDAPTTTITPFREPISTAILPAEAMQVLPEPKTYEKEEAPDPKAKGGKKDAKKGGKAGGGEDDGAVLANPLENMLSLIDEQLAPYKKEMFTVNRELYEADEAVCVAVEQAVWFEAEKLTLLLDELKKDVENQTAWLEETESSLIAMLNDIIARRDLKEMNAVKRLLEFIEATIEAAETLVALWLVSPDCDPPVDPAAVWSQFSSHLNQDSKHGTDRLADVCHYTRALEARVEAGQFPLRDDAGLFNHMKRRGRARDGKLKKEEEEDGRYGHESMVKSPSGRMAEVVVAAHPGMGEVLDGSGSRGNLHETGGGASGGSADDEAVALDADGNAIVMGDSIDEPDSITSRGDISDNDDGVNSEPDGEDEEENEDDLGSISSSIVIREDSVDSSERRAGAADQGAPSTQKNNSNNNNDDDDGDGEDNKKTDAEEAAAEKAALAAQKKREKQARSEAIATRKRAREKARIEREEKKAEKEYKVAMEKYLKAHARFESTLRQVRHDREMVFYSMGMAPAVAKLAAFNELLLDEQHQTKAFEARNKPVRRKVKKK